MRLETDHPEIAAAAARGDPDQFRAAIEAHLVAPWRTGRKLAHYASMFRIGGVFRRLAEAGEANDLDCERQTPLHYAALSGTADKVRVMVDRFGCDPRAADVSGATPLHLAVARTDFLQQGDHPRRIVELLLERGADPNAATETGQTPLHFSAKSRCPDMEMARILAAAGGRADSRDMEGRTPSDLAELDR